MWPACVARAMMTGSAWLHVMAAGSGATHAALAFLTACPRLNTLYARTAFQLAEADLPSRSSVNTYIHFEQKKEVSTREWFVSFLEVS